MTMRELYWNVTISPVSGERSTPEQGRQRKCATALAPVDNSGAFFQPVPNDRI